MNDNSPERRNTYRLMHEVSIFLETLAPSPDEDPIGQISLCGSLDISPTGLRMKLDQALPLQAILQMAIQFADKQRFHLVAEVRWVKENSDGFETGFFILESDQTDFIAWRALFEHGEPFAFDSL